MRRRKMKKILWIFLLVITLSCSKNIEQPKQIVESVPVVTTNTVKQNIKQPGQIMEHTPLASAITIKQNIVNENTEKKNVSVLLNNELLTEFDWSLDDGGYLVDPFAEPVDWIGRKAPIAVFQKVEIPEDSVLYQVRLRNELFYFRYQTKEKDLLYPAGGVYGTEPYDIKFLNDFSIFSRYRKNMPYGNLKRAGPITSQDYPLVGIWGEWPVLFEYRLVDPTGCLYYLEIDKTIPGYAVRYGTYLLKKTGDNLYETISSFPDGHLQLEVVGDTRLVFTPLFTLPEEDGKVAPLIMWCSLYNPRFLKEDY
jgi:hypothetical protein